MAGANTQTFDDANFETEVLQSPIPVLVDFWAEWCGPCRMVAPIIDELATEYAGRVKVGKVDIDKAQKLAARYSVNSIPTVMVFQGGKVVQNMLGLRAKNAYKAVLDQLVGAA